MIRKAALLLACLTALGCWAISWDEVTSSGRYYYGEGTAETEEEANKKALDALCSNISVLVQSSFTKVDEITNTNERIDQTTKVNNCIRTYANQYLADVEHGPKTTSGGMVTVRRYMERTKLEEIFEKRKAMVLEIASNADYQLGRSNVGRALQYYYNAYSLLCMLQNPYEVKDASGASLILSIPEKIEDILSDVTVEYESPEISDSNDENCYNLVFRHKGKPASLTFHFNDGRGIVKGNVANKGNALVYQRKECEGNPMHIDIEYKFDDTDSSDKDMNAAYAAVKPLNYGTASHKVVQLGSPAKAAPRKADTPAASSALASAANADTKAQFDIKESQVSDSQVQCEKVMAKVVDAVTRRSFSSIMDMFTPDGLERYESLINYGKGRIKGKPDLKYYKGLDGTTVVRGLQMEFVVGKSRQTFAEDVVVTIDASGKISNVAFGLGDIATNDILAKEGAGWKDYTHEMLIEFMENYKTAYSLKDLDFIKSIYSDGAIIYVGNVLKPQIKRGPEGQLSALGREIISHNQYDKNAYIDHLEKVFKRNDFINIGFGHADAMWLDKFTDKEKYAININQDYRSTGYSDKGYLFLIIDMTDHNEPQIEVRTWQPNEVPVDQIYHAGYFYSD